MVIVGLTGSIGMGKSETARMFRELGVRVYDADAAVHRIYEAGGPAVAPLEAAFPGVSDENGVNRDELSKHVLDNPDAMKKLESIVHPLVAQEQINFLRDAAAAGVDFTMMLGVLTGGWQMARAAHAAANAKDTSDGDPAFMTAKQTTASAYMAYCLPEINTLAARMAAGPDALANVDPALL